MGCSIFVFTSWKVINCIILTVIKPFIFNKVIMAAELEREWTTFPGKAKSTVWKYFGFWKIIKQEAPSEIMKDKTVCKLCKAEYKYNRNTTNLSQHLSKFHPDELKQSTPATLQQTFNNNEGTSQVPSSPFKTFGRNNKVHCRIYNP